MIFSLSPFFTGRGQGEGRQRVVRGRESSRDFIRKSRPARHHFIQSQWLSLTSPAGILSP